jgi:site-specific DNA-methyltransferase (adenine-specific)
LFFKGKHPRFGIADGNSGGPVSRFFYCARATALDRCEYNDHPCVKPAALMQYLAALVTYPDDNLILDPFSGSGSTAVACRILEYQGIRVSTVNFDLVPRYLGIGYRRVRDAQPPRRKRC